MKKILSGVIASALSISLLSSLNLSGSVSGSAASGINVNYHTKQEIIDYIESAGIDIDMETKYAVTPNYISAPYSAGKLTDATLDNALKTLNLARYIAGIDNVELSESYNELTQAGALVNAVNDVLSHTPDQPSGMSDELYNKGYEGTSSSNIAWGYSSLSDAVMYGWLSDGDSYNIDRLGHRRWCLNPSMKKTGFGQVEGYSAMYSFDGFSDSSEYYGVCWPAQSMPTEYFADSDPWSISTGSVVNADKAKVTLVRKSDGKTWNFSSSSADGYFNVNNAGYGKTGCIIFRPDSVSYNDGDVFDVSVTGLSTDVKYTVEFFDSVQKITPTEPTDPIISNIIGDISGNGNIDLYDVIDIATYLLGDKSYTDSEMKIADYDQNGKVDLYDAIGIAKYLLNNK